MKKGKQELIAGWPVDLRFCAGLFARRPDAGLVGAGRRARVAARRDDGRPSRSSGRPWWACAGHCLRARRNERLPPAALTERSSSGTCHRYLIPLCRRSTAYAIDVGFALGELEMKHNHRFGIAAVFIVPGSVVRAGGGRGRRAQRPVTARASGAAARVPPSRTPRSLAASIDRLLASRWAEAKVRQCPARG